MICGQCGRKDIRFFEHVEQHRIIETEADSTIYLSRAFPQDDSVLKDFFECCDCGWQTTEEELNAKGFKVERIG